MKKFISLLCMITCVFGLTACGSSEEYTEHEKYKIELAKQYATQDVVPYFEQFNEDAELVALFDEYTAEEVAGEVSKEFGIEVDGYALKTAIESFLSGYETIGGVVEIGEATAVIDDKQIIVTVEIKGGKQNAKAEVIFSNDKFTKLQSAALNPVESMGNLMTKAALNTLIGMGTVFAVLLLISFIISCFGVIPKIQAKMSKQDKQENEKEVQTNAIENTVAQIATKEEVVNLTDDFELVAVIAAAIAASEGATSTDGFVVRSIRKVRR